MKKFIIAVLAVGVIGTTVGLTSCTKGFECACSYDDGSGNKETSSQSLEATTREEASASCDAIEVGLKSSFSDVSCSLK